MNGDDYVDVYYYYYDYDVDYDEYHGDNKTRIIIKIFHYNYSDNTN